MKFKLCRVLTDSQKLEALRNEEAIYITVVSSTDVQSRQIYGTVYLRTDKLEFCYVIGKFNTGEMLMVSLGMSTPSQ